ncbi:MAG: hypothetical protein ACYDB7_06880 [Mycobacteriales bacterium]
MTGTITPISAFAGILDADYGTGIGYRKEVGSSAPTRSRPQWNSATSRPCWPPRGRVDRGGEDPRETPSVTVSAA